MRHAGRCAVLRRDGGRSDLAAAALVRARAPRPAVAAHPRPLRDPRLGGHAPADAGRAGGPALRGVAGALAHRRRAGGGGAARTCCASGSASATTAARCACGRRRGWWRATAGRQRLQELPGVGPYTAAAVGSFAFGRQEVALDTNARRLFARLGTALVPPPGARGGLQPGDDGAGRDGVHGAGAALRRVPAARGLRRPRAAGSARARRASASRTPIAGSAAAWWRRWRRARGCRAASRPTAWQPALQGLLRDGLIRQVAGGYALG